MCILNIVQKSNITEVYCYILMTMYVNLGECYIIMVFSRDCENFHQGQDELELSKLVLLYYRKDCK